MKQIHHLTPAASLKKLILITITAALAACSSAPQQSANLEKQSGALGTQWGEGRESNTVSVEAKRRNELQADEMVTVAYSDAQTLFKAYSSKAKQLNIPMLNGEVEWSFQNEKDQPLALVASKNSAERYQLGGQHGERYSLVFKNLGKKDYEIVATVDGLDVLNGKPGSVRNSGYILRGKQTLVIDGFRKSSSEVAAFRFAAVDRAYAANTAAGDVRNIGVIGAAVFRIDLAEPKPRGKAFPADNGYAPEPSY